MYRHVRQWQRQARLMAEAATLLREYHYREAAEAAEAVEQKLIKSADRDAALFRQFQ